MVPPARYLSLVLAIAAMTPAAIASAETPKPMGERCIEANQRAQSLRRSGDFTGAHEQLAMCASARCPAMVRDDCAARLDDLERAQPTIVFDPKTPEGADVTAVEVLSDGRPWVTKLDGTALPLDPGEHRFTFEAPGQPPVTRQIVLREGEKGRHETVVIGIPKPASPVQAPALPVSVSPPPPRSSSVGRPLGVIVGSVGLAGIALGSIFGLFTKAAVDRQNQDCPSTSCGNYSAALQDHDQAVQDGLISDVAFVAGGVLLAGGAALFFLSGPEARPSTETASGVAVLPSVGPSGGGISLRGTF